MSKLSFASSETAPENPRPFVVMQNGTFLFVIHAYSARQARTLVAARLADTTGVVIAAPRRGSR
jgi:hypothetical protein